MHLNSQHFPTISFQFYYFPECTLSDVSSTAKHTQLYTVYVELLASQILGDLL